MLPLLLAWPLVAALAAAVDAVWTRLGLPHRPVEPSLFAQAWLLWLGYGLAGLVPAALVAALRRRRVVRRSGGALRRTPVSAATAAGLVLFWTVLPVAVHGVLDRHTAIGADASALLAPGPWLQAAVVALVLAALAVGVGLAVRALGPRRSAALALGAALVAGLALPLGGREGALEEMAASDVDGDPARPNVLLLVWDTTRAPSLGAYGSPRATSPELDALVEDALLFEEARSVTVFTFSSHLTMLTGRYPAQHGGRLTHMVHDPERGPSVARLLRAEGYRTGAFVGTSVLAAHTGIDDGFEVYDDRVDPPVCDTRGWALVHDVQAVLAALSPRFHANGRPHGIQDFQRPADEVLGAARDWIESDDPRPWFCMVNLYDAHWPYLPEGDGRALVGPYDGPMNGFGSRADDLRGREYEPTPDDARHLTELYEAEIFDLDAAVSEFLGALEIDAGGTGVVLTSDHGEAFGEAGVWEHDDIYEPQVRIPLLVRPPGPEPEGERVAAPASGIDVAPTLLGLAGVEPPSELPGLDLTRERPEPERRTVVQDRDGLTVDHDRLALYAGRWKLERRGAPGERTWALYDLGRDAVGEVDVSHEHSEVLGELRAELEAWEATVGVEALEGGAEASTRDALEALGYLGN